MAKKSKNQESPVDYEVGRGKPPKHSRFKPGQSGNPGGRRKGSVNVKTVVRKTMESTIEVNENGQKRKVSVMEAVVLNLTQLALRGNVKASLVMLDFAERYCDAENWSESTELEHLELEFSAPGSLGWEERSR